jgi:hypothetical protein
VTVLAATDADRRGRWSATATRLAAPPVLAWLAANALYWTAADRAGYDYFLVRTHARWDSGNYLRSSPLWPRWSPGGWPVSSTSTC